MSKFPLTPSGLRPYLTLPELKRQNRLIRLGLERKRQRNRQLMLNSNGPTVPLLKEDEDATKS